MQINTAKNTCFNSSGLQANYFNINFGTNCSPLLSRQKKMVAEMRIQPEVDKNWSIALPQIRIEYSPVMFAFFGTEDEAFWDSVHQVLEIFSSKKRF